MRARAWLSISCGHDSGMEREMLISLARFSLATNPDKLSDPIMGRCWTGYTSISGDMPGMAHSHGIRWQLDAMWDHPYSHGYDLRSKYHQKKCASSTVCGVRNVSCDLRHPPRS